VACSLKYRIGGGVSMCFSRISVLKAIVRNKTLERKNHTGLPALMAGYEMLAFWEWSQSIIQDDAKRRKNGQSRD